MEIPVIHIFTHDSIGVGEDGPTHQPVEQLASLRAMPGPDHVPARRRQRGRRGVALIMQLQARAGRRSILSRQDAADARPHGVRAPRRASRKGAYVLADAPDGEPDVILIGDRQRGVASCVARVRDARRGGRQGPRRSACRRWELFDRQTAGRTATSVLPPAVTARVAIEQASTLGWDRYVG